MLQCLKLQQEEYKRLCRYVEIKRAEALREAGKTLKQPQESLNQISLRVLKVFTQHKWSFGF